MYQPVVFGASLVVLCGLVATNQQVDASREEAAIRQLSKDWFAAENRRDLEASMAYFAPNAIVQSEGMPAIDTSDGIRALYKEFFALPYTELVMGQWTVVVAASGDLAYETGPWTMVTGPKREPLKTTVVWKKIDGKWKAVVIAFTADTPMTPPPQQ